MKESHEKKNGGLFGRIRSYWKNNFSIRLSLISAAALLMAALAFWQYLRREYLAYLTDTALGQDQVLAEIEADSVNQDLSQIMRIAAVTSLDKNLLASAKTFSENENDVNSKLTLRRLIEEIIRQYRSELSNIAIVTRDGDVIYQRNRAVYVTSSGNMLWDSSTQSQLKSLCSDLLDQIDMDTVPRAAFSSDPGSFFYTINNTNISYSTNLYNVAVALPGNQRSSSGVDLILVMTFEPNSLDDFFRQLDGISGKYLEGCITDNDGTVIYADNKEWIGLEKDDVFSSSLYQTVSAPVSGSDWTLNIIIDTQEIRRLVSAQYMRGLAIFFAAILAIGTVQVVVTQRTLAPIRSIRRAMKSMHEGSLEKRIEIRGENEIWHLAKNYNEMADALAEWKAKDEKQHQEKMEQVQKTAQAQMHALQSQINAHFLCNTLNAINMSAIEQGNEEVSRMLRMLSNIMRYAYSRSYETVTLGDEAEWVSQYLALQKFRLMDVFNYKVDFPKSYLDWPCCKLFLQPFVENSIKHGFFQKERDCFLSITGRLSGDRMMIVIEDNGCGMNEDQLARVKEELAGKNMRTEGTGIGIENVAARLRIFYGGRFDISVESELGKGTRFTLYLPIPDQLLGQEE